MWRCLDRMRKPWERRSVRDYWKRKATVASKKPVAAGTESGTDPVAPPSMAK